MNNFLEHVPVLLDEILENLKKFDITNGVICLLYTSDAADE